MDLTYEPATKQLRDKLKEMEVKVLYRVTYLADAVANDVINHARSKSGKTVPGSPVNSAGNYIPKGQRTTRKAHPGNWADVTSQLASSIQRTIETNGLQVRAIVEATAEYAAALDAKTGYDVLGGAQQIARRSIKKHANKHFE